MAYTLVANVKAQSADSNGITSAAINTTGANLIVIVVADYGSQTASAISDSKGNTYSAAVTNTSTSRVRLLYCYAPTVGSGHTFTATQNGSYVSLAVLAFSGAASSPLDQTNSNFGVGVTSVTPGSVTPTENNELVVCCISGEAVGAPDSVSVNGGFTITDSGVNVSGTCFGIAAAYLVQTTAAAANPTFSWTTSSGTRAVSATFKVSSATSYTLSAGGGSFAVSGTAASLLKGSKVAAAGGSFTITGTAASLKRGYLVSAASGSFAITGTAATLTHSGGSIWTPRSAQSTTWTADGAQSTSWTPRSAQSTTWTAQ